MRLIEKQPSMSVKARTAVKAAATLFRIDKFTNIRMASSTTENVRWLSDLQRVSRMSGVATN
jgi:hypothetical protein